MPVQIWTMQMARRHQAKAEDIHLLDITVMTGIGAFAPDKRALWRYKYNEIDSIEYTRLYIERMQWSQKEFPEVWDKLDQHERVAVACYCRAGDFCHRHLFVPLMENTIKAKGGESVYMGELLPPESSKTEK